MPHQHVPGPGANRLQPQRHGRVHKPATQNQSLLQDLFPGIVKEDGTIGFDGQHI
jgi:hypothetical protein